MPELQELLIEELQGILDAENQLVRALPKMASAAKSPKLREGFEKHLRQTEMQVERLNRAFELLGSEAEPKSCRAMTGLIEEGEEKIGEADGKAELIGDLSLIAAAQKVEHYEIAAYGNAQTLANQIEQREVATLLRQTLGEEESTDYLLTEIAKPLLQEARSEDLGATGSTGATRRAATSGRKTRHA
jgi:Mn-containing catalase